MNSKIKANEQEITKRAIENGFPIEEISIVAELESYRKELNRPIYYLQKWWARRLGSVFRALIIGSLIEDGSKVLKNFYKRHNFEGVRVYDPFMGSGTTVGEAYKLGCTAIGKDINPVAYRGVKAALGPLDYDQVEKYYNKLKKSVGRKLRNLYKGYDSKGSMSDVLYYFWVKVINCPSCKQEVELFSSYVFAKHAYPKKYPRVHVYCPSCRSIIKSHYKKNDVICPKCDYKFNQNEGPAKRVNATCKHCDHSFTISKAFKELGYSPKHKLYAKLVLREDGNKEYLPITNDDLVKYNTVSELLEKHDFKFPKIPLKNGYNTDQVLNYGYKYWHQFFNDRQLYGLILLAEEIYNLPESNEKDAFIGLFSGLLEFNNMFASYKGEGTGAVRHMFSHHILKPERTPLEANIWGTTKSSGSFSGLYKSRLLRMLKYREDPFEIRPTKSGKSTTKVRGINKRINAQVKSITKEIEFDENTIYLSCGDSANADLPAKSIDFVITDPPFFDNVHYSELADFFYTWQQIFFYNSKGHDFFSTRSAEEVQDIDEKNFSVKLRSVFQECKRVLKDSGLLIFSYHHSKESGWTSLGKAVVGAGFSIIQAHPIKSEMSQSTTKKSNPIDIDVILVCAKKEFDYRTEVSTQKAFEKAICTTTEKVKRFNDKGRKLSRNDIKVMLYSHCLVELSPNKNEISIVESLKNISLKNEKIVPSLYKKQEVNNIKNEDQRSFKFDEVV